MLDGSADPGSDAVTHGLVLAGGQAGNRQAPSSFRVDGDAFCAARGTWPDATRFMDRGGARPSGPD